jgi:hypothetical protein
MIDIWGHGSNGSSINMVYNTYYGMGYNNTTLTKSRFEINSYSTQVAQLQFEYKYELDKIWWVRSLCFIKAYWILEYLMWVIHIRDKIVQ